MKSVLVTLLSLAGLLAVSTGLDVADMPPVMRTDSSALATGSADIPTDASENPDTNLTKLNATVAGNNVLVTRSNIIVIGDQAKKGVVDFIKNLVMKGSSPQDDDALSTQIITVLGGNNSTATNSDLATKMVPKIKSAFLSREKPAQLRQIIVKLTEMSPKFDATEVGDHDA
ncbi:hypothetical protein JG687_00018227 [Phytophthora cactorum]|uniref:RxLR effector protein n=1 Tax=Phytophthora cactorum TaxID=29920 RepID=A0A329SCK9_9STRA|nr:hypothetical protein Pcac1_g10041 [Phytophthora cactorum]KAG2794906.1 hypothetical protein PC112_g22855 [Phytophthora cactorum]KAG2795086.1 hypothetical protein PC111_g22302 [Phytophthora cactorum]KAG2820962.1 hypothetical protein PC113_g22539 [Phytophthora cactorum]KAG2874093.1 hypothetical protein PC114_g25481 [Phytophthora cactorum]